MKPAAFDYVRAGSVAEVTRLLRDANGDAKIIAGAQSLGPMLNLRLVRPPLLIDITGIPEMTRVDEEGEAITVGACVTTANIEDGRVAQSALPGLPTVAANIAYRAVRNRGTIGGSVCHADPAADWVSALSVLGAECIVAGVSSNRRIAIEQFITGAFETVLEPEEILDAIRIPRPSSEARVGYSKICRKAGEFAMSIGAVLHDPARDIFRMVIGATQGRPIVIADARKYCSGGSPAGGARIEQDAIGELFEERGITSPVARRQHTAVLQRALDQVAKS